MAKPCVFIGFGETSGYCAGLKRGFDEIGIPAVSFMITENRFQFGDSGRGRLLASICAILKKREALQAQAEKTASRAVKLGCALRRLALALAQNAVWLAVVVWAVAKFDVFVLQGRTSFINVFRFPVKPRFLDLAVLKLFRKKIIYVFHGTDSRPAYINGAIGTRRLNARQLIQYGRRQARDVRTIEKYADAILHYPLNTHFHRKRIISHEFIGRPVFIAHAIGEPKPAEAGLSVKIVHAPSDPVGKGSERIREIIERLRQKGHPIDFIELVDKTNEEVKDSLQKCDFLVDQLYYDVAISYLATEAAFLGKPAVIGSYAKDELPKTAPGAVWPPVHMCAPDDMEQAIEKMITDSKLRRRLGAQAREFVEKHYGPKRVAENFLRVIGQDVPREWLFDPNSLEYCHGYGYTEEKVKEVIRGVVQEGGESALSLDGKPALKQRMLRFAFDERPVIAPGLGRTVLEGASG
jgi:glycosyltransferase involved in cell wall biosynthesis